MLDIKFIRENKEIVRDAIVKKKSIVDLDHVLSLDQEYREALQKVETLRSERNRFAKEKNIEEGKRIKDQLQQQEHVLTALKDQLDAKLLQIPNIPDKSVPIGRDETENIEVRKWGEAKQFNFKVKDHIELGEHLGIINVQKASEVSGARFSYLLGGAALLEFALINYAFNVLGDKELLQSIAKKIDTNYSSRPFIPVVPPVMIRPDIFQKMARIEPKEERYYLEKDEMFLIGSAEHTLGPLHMNETLIEDNLPVRYVGFSTAFRREAGSYGKDTKGILRVHQFDKIEIESFTLPENSIKEQDFIVSLQEYLMQTLEIPYRVVMICTGDMGGPDARQIDIESWIPSQQKYRETHTSDMMTDYQSRRLNTKVKRKNNTTEFVHMNDATVFAIGRTLIAILENYQQEDGSVIVPKVLQQYTGFNIISSQ